MFPKTLFLLNLMHFLCAGISASSIKYSSIFDAHLPQEGEGREFGPRPLNTPEHDDTFSIHDVYNIPVEQTEKFDGHFQDFDEDLDVQDPGCPEPQEHISDDVLFATKRLLDMAVPYHLPNYKSHCWYECLEAIDPTENNPYVKNIYTKHLHIVKEKLTSWRINHHKYWMLHCLPYFYMMGSPRSGSSDLLAKLSLHPDVVPPPRRDPLWWNVIRYQEMDVTPNEMQSFRHYIQLYDYEAEEIRRHFVTDDNGKPYHKKIIGEMSNTLMWYNYIWRRAPENENKDEPVMLSPHYMKHIHPEAKFIIMLRNPVERLYSSFLYFTPEGNDRSAGEFHRVVTECIPIIQTCIDVRGIRSCLYDADLTRGLGDPGLRLGMYAQYLIDWFEVYPKEQLHLVRYGRYRDDPRGVLQDIFNYLDLDIPSEDDMNTILGMPWLMNNHPFKDSAEPILEETKQILIEFYKPYNEHLAAVMDDPEYLWPM